MITSGARRQPSRPPGHAVKASLVVSLVLRIFSNFSYYINIYFTQSKTNYSIIIKTGTPCTTYQQRRIGTVVTPADKPQTILSIICIRASVAAITCNHIHRTVHLYSGATQRRIIHLRDTMLENLEAILVLRISVWQNTFVGCTKSLGEANGSMLYGSRTTTIAHHKRW